MKIAFVHDHKIIKYNNKYYSSGSFPYSVFQRYLNIFDELLFVSRLKIAEENFSEKNVALASGKGVEFISVPNPLTFRNYIYNNEIINKKLLEVISNCDGVIARLPSALGIKAIKLAKKLNKPWAIELVGDPWESLWNYGGITGKVYAPLQKHRIKKILKESKFTLYVTKNTLQKKYPSYGKVISVSNVEIPDVSRDVLKNRIEKINKLTENSIIKIGMIGALNAKYKGFEIALDIVHELYKAGKKIEFEIVGGGDQVNLQKVIKKLGLNKVVKIVGTLESGEEIFSWLDSVDIYIQPSLTEGLPRALIEAMSRGCYCLGSTAGGISELLQEMHMHKPTDKDNFINNIVKAIESKDELKTYSIKNFENAKLYYKSKLEINRNEFWEQFKKYIKND